MTIFEQVNEDIKAAMKAKEKDKLDALRGVKSALLLAATEKGGGGNVDDATALKIIQKLVKQRKDSATIFREQNRADLAEPEELQAEFIEAYLPKQMGEAAVKAEVAAAVEQLGASGMKDMGKVMGMLNKKLAGKVDGKMLADAVKAALS